MQLKVAQPRENRPVVRTNRSSLSVMDRALPATEGSIVLALIEGAFLLAGVSSDAAGRRIVPTALSESSDGRAEDAVIIGVARWAIHRLWPVRHAPHGLGFSGATKRKQS